MLKANMVRFSLLAVLTFFASYAFANTVTTTELYQQVEKIRGELTLIQKELGKPYSPAPVFTVSSAAPREIYFQALALFKKSNRLRFEIMRTLAKKPTIPSGEITTGDVMQVLGVVMRQVTLVKHKLGIPEKVELREVKQHPNNNDLFMAIVGVNRQLNMLLEKQMMPSDVYQRVTEAINITATLLAQFPRTAHFPKALPYARRKNPQDVYEQLFKSYSLLQSIAKYSNVNILSVHLPEKPINEILPGDVYNIAELIVSEVSYFHTQLSGASSPVDVYYPGRKIVSDVYQRATILHAQLIELEGKVKTHPYWLKNES